MNFRSYFHFKWIPNRESERERERESERKKRRTSSSSSTIARTSRTGLVDRSTTPITPRCLISRALVQWSHRAARSRELQSDDRSAPIATRRSHLRSRLCAISPSTHRSSTHRSLSLCDFDFCVILIFVVVVVVWWWCFCGCGFWLPKFATLGWIAMWKICRKIAFSTIQPNTRKYFSQYFLKYNQTLKNIFLSGK